MLAGRYYVYRKTVKDSSKDEGREAALNYVPNQVHRVPKRCCVMCSLVSQLLFGVEAFSLLKGLLLTCIKDKETEMSAKRCNHYRKGQSRCRCCHKHKWVVFLKSFAISVFTRRQPNYQRLSVYCLLNIFMVFDHEDDKCFSLATKRMQGCLTVNESGDSFVMEPADLLQEKTIVGITKHHGGRDPNAANSMQARVQVASFKIAKEVERKGLKSE